MDNDKLLGLISLSVVAYLILKENNDDEIVVETPSLIPTNSIQPPFINTTYIPPLPVFTPVFTPPVVNTIFGCTNPLSTNYNPLATDDDTSCILESIPSPVLGCIDSTANNYNSLATQDDGSCTYNPPSSPIFGCIDPTADNFSQYANSDDGSCVYNTGNSYNNGNLECWDDVCPSASVVSNPTWTSCPSTHPFSNPPVCTVAPVPGLDISFDNLSIGVFNINNCVYSVDINIINMPAGYIWNMKRLSLLNGVWSWNQSSGYATNSIMTASSITKTGLCPGRYVVTILGPNGTYGGGMVMEKELIINPSGNKLEIVSTTPSGGSCNGGVSFVVKQRCSPSAPPWSNCNMSFSNKTKFVIKDSMGAVVLDSGAYLQYGTMGVNMNSITYVYDLKPSGSSRTSSIASSTYQDSWMNINLCSGNYTLELIRNNDLSILETTNFTIQ